MTGEGTDFVFWFNQGGAIALLVLIFLMIYRIAVWLGTQWLIPLRDAIIAHLKILDTTLEELTESMRAQRAAIEEIQRRMTSGKG